MSLARSTVPGEDVCIGAGTSIGEGSRVVQSVVGRNVRIGRNVDIVGAYIQDGVTIQVGREGAWAASAPAPREGRGQPLAVGV